MVNQPHLSINTTNTARVKNNQTEGLDRLKLTTDPEEVEGTLGSASNRVWPELVSRKRGRHSYAYYQPNLS